VMHIQCHITSFDSAKCNNCDRSMSEKAECFGGCAFQTSNVAAFGVSLPPVRQLRLTNQKLDQTRRSHH